VLMEERGGRPDLGSRAVSDVRHVGANRTSFRVGP
jgi:hypothetical protein